MTRATKDKNYASE